MSATDELRRMLDEREVDWVAEDDLEEPAYYFVTKWFANGCEQTYEEIPAIRSRSLKAYCVTPEQAIAATLGVGTCRNIDVDCDSYFECSECGCHVLCDFYGWGYGKPRFCPGCGRKVEG